MKIFTDTSTLYAPQEAEKLGFKVLPLSVSVNGKTYKEFEEKSKGWTEETTGNIAKDMMRLFVEFGEMKELDPSDEKVQTQVKKLQDYITENFYNCTTQILSGLGQMYAAGGDFTVNIDNAGGEGTAEFCNKAIQIYCK